MKYVFLSQTLIYLRRGLDNIQASRRTSTLFKAFDLKEMISCLEDLINYFAYPEDDLGRYTFVF